MFCKRCRYNLKLIASRTCPECGRAFDPGNPKTYRKGVGLPRRLRRLLQILLVLFALVSIALAVIEVRYQKELAAADALEQIGADVAWSDDAHQWARRIPILHQRLQRVDGLSLWYNQLTTLPPEIGNLTKLEWLDLSNSQLATLPTEIGKFTKLEWLCLSEDKLTTLPPEIGNLTELEVLDLGYNQLTTLPPEIGNLTKLERLDLSGNQLTTLPLEIGNLTKLEVLDLDFNQLTTLPPQIGNLTKLTRLYFKGNPITDADLQHLYVLKNLSQLHLRGTKVTEQGVAALRLALPNCRIHSDFD